MISNTDRFLAYKPFDNMEFTLAKAIVEHPDWLTLAEETVLKYALNFARLGWMPIGRHHKVDVFGDMAAYRRTLLEVLSPMIGENRGAVERGALKSMVGAVKRKVHDERARLLRTHANDFGLDQLDNELCEKHLAMVAGGGGGAGYVYLGAYKILQEYGLIPSLLVGTSIGSVISAFRARYKQYPEPEVATVTSALSWGALFNFLNKESRFGIPATMRLKLRKTIGPFFLDKDGGHKRMRDLDIPLYVIITGIKREALTHDLDYYARLVETPAAAAGIRKLGYVRRKVKDLMGLFSELVSRPALLRKIVIGRDPSTLDFDVLDAIGFSSAVPGVIQYDVTHTRTNRHHVIQKVVDEHHVHRLIDGGVIDNVPADVAWEAIQDGAIGSRNVFIAAMDCFAPRPLSMPLWLPIQRMIQDTVTRNKRFANYVKSFQWTLSPLNLVPQPDELGQCITSGYREMAEDIAAIAEVLKPLAGLGMERDVGKAYLR